MTNNFSSSTVLEVWAMTQFALQIILHIQAQLVTETTSGSLKGCSKQLLASFARSCLVSCKAIAFVERLRGLSLFLSCVKNLPFWSVQTYLFTGVDVIKELFSIFTCVTLYKYREVFTVS